MDYSNFALFSDLDGTLFNSNTMVSEENKKAIYKFQEGGGLFAVSTGRTQYKVKSILSDIVINAPSILYNGSGVYDFMEDAYIKTYKVDKKNIDNMISWVILATVVVNMFNLDGSVNQILNKIGIGSMNFLGSNTLFQPLLIMTDVWKEFGYSSIVFLAAITSIDPGLYEAAAIDGANWWQKTWHVTLPGMLSIILLISVMNIANVLNAGFDQVYNLYSPMVYETGDIIDTYVYRMGLLNHQYSFSTAVGLFKSFVGMFLMLFVNGLSKKFTDARIF